MTTTPTDLDHLFAAAGRALARRREDDAQRERERRDGDRRRAERHASVVERAGTAGPAVFAWIEGDEAEALRACMRAAGLDLVALTPWLGSDGSTRERPSSFSWCVYLMLDGGLVVQRVGLIGAGMGHRRLRVATAAELLDAVAPGVLLRLVEDVRDGRILEHVAAGLRADVERR